MYVTVSITVCEQSEEEQKKWKLVTLWIGGNDLCRYCSSSVSNVIKYIHVHVVEVAMRNRCTVFACLVGWR